LTFDAGNDRRGLVAAGPDPAQAAIAWTSPELDGVVYGQALVQSGMVLVATEGDSVYALSGADGSVVWTTHLGTPVPRSALPCGNIDPTGITGTPVVDPATGTLYVVAFVEPGRHELVALDVATGVERWRHGIDPPGLSARVEQQRAALTLANGQIYVPFGGLYGDCGAYKGAVVALAADGTGDASSWIVPTAREGGIWAPSGVAVDRDGSLYAATGNAASTDPARFDYGNTVVRLTAELTLADWWAPTDWAQLSAADRDLGSQGPVLVDAVHAFVAGKNGVGYLLSTGGLGNVGGETSKVRLCDGAFGASATNGDTIVVACSNGPATATLSNDTLTAGWHHAGGRGGPPVIAGDTVWLTSNDGDTRALALGNGEVLADVPIAPSLPGFPGTTVTPTAVYVTGSNSVTALR
jgi:PQQ-like domain